MTFLERAKQLIKQWEVVQDGTSYDDEHDVAFDMYELLVKLAQQLEEGW